MTTAQQNAFDFEFETVDGKRMPLSAFRGQALLVVNTASRCMFTEQYGPMNELYKRYRDRGFTVVGVPSNDFQQQPEDGEAITQFCQIKFFTEFPVTGKAHVVGKNAHPFFKWIRARAGFFATPKWNFYKYLIGPDGQLVSWHFSITSPLSGRITRRIEKLLAAKK